MATTQSIIKSMPEDVVELIARVLGDGDVDSNDKEVKMLLPASPVVDVILGYIGVGSPPKQSDLDQAQAWIEEQYSWQDRAEAVKGKLQELQPFSEEQALKGEIPLWMNAPWAQKLLFSWSDGLRDAVIDAEDYVDKL